MEVEQELTRVTAALKELREAHVAAEREGIVREIWEAYKENRSLISRTPTARWGTQLCPDRQPAVLAAVFGTSKSDQSIGAKRITEHKNIRQPTPWAKQYLEEHKAKLQSSLNMSPDLRTVIHLATGPPAQVPTVDMRAFQSGFTLGLIKAGGSKPTGAGPRTDLERTVERQLRNFQRDGCHGGDGADCSYRSKCSASPTAAERAPARADSLESSTDPQEPDRPGAECDGAPLPKRQRLQREVAAFAVGKFGASAAHRRSRKRQGIKEVFKIGEVPLAEHPAHVTQAPTRTDEAPHTTIMTDEVVKIAEVLPGSNVHEGERTEEVPQEEHEAIKTPIDGEGTAHTVEDIDAFGTTDDHSPG
ncbi:unnamed protein product, partial [Prorocentrum cordatum]